MRITNQGRRSIRSPKSPKFEEQESKSRARDEETNIGMLGDMEGWRGRRLGVAELFGGVGEFAGGDAAIWGS